MLEVLVETANLGRVYKRGETSVVALASATCKVLSGDRIAIIGPSGSGKSTLLQIMAGLDTPTSGTIRWPALGDYTTLRPSNVALVFQQPSLLAPLTAVENVELPLLLGGSGERQARRAAMEALQRLQLGGITDKLPEELSGGQAQRVAMARAIASSPRVIFADEPTGQLDHASAKHLLDALLADLHGTNTALVVATHDPLVAERMHHGWHMQHGLLEVKE